MSSISLGRNLIIHLIVHEALTCPAEGGVGQLVEK